MTYPSTGWSAISFTGIFPVTIKGVSRRAVIRRQLAVVMGCLSGCAPAGPTTTASTAAQLDTAFALARQEPNLTSLVISRGGVTEREEYFHGGGADTPQAVWSVTKSVIGLAVGAAIDRGCLHSLDQTLGELLGPSRVTDPQKRVITLGQLLTMSSGLDFPEMASYTDGSGLFQNWLNAPDQVAWVLARPLTAMPGQRFEYGSATIHLASVALTRACGESTAEFTRGAVFAPLGIPARAWDTDRQGFNQGGFGLSLSPRDMQAIGNLVLNGGEMGHRRVVSAEWIAAMTQSRLATGAGMPTPEYGYAWWLGQVSGVEYALALGWGGQFIMVVPARQLVVTAAARTTGLSSNAAMSQWSRIFNLITGRIVPAY